MTLVLRTYRRFAQLIHELAKFGTVGAASMVVDVGGNNLLHLVLGVGPMTSKTLSVATATTLAYAGNRCWTFRHRDRTGLAREYFLFWVLNGVALLISLLCVGFTYYTLRLTGPLAYNISANVVGLILGTAFRYWSYKKWVFLPPSDPAVDPHTGLPAPGGGDERRTITLRPVRREDLRHVPYLPRRAAGDTPNGHRRNH